MLRIGVEVNWQNMKWQILKGKHRNGKTIKGFITKRPRYKFGKISKGKTIKKFHKESMIFAFKFLREKPFYRV